MKPFFKTVSTTVVVELRRGDVRENYIFGFLAMYKNTTKKIKMQLRLRENSSDATVCIKMAARCNSTNCDIQTSRTGLDIRQTR